MRRDVYLHSLHASHGDYSSEKTLQLLETIIQSGALLSPRLSGVKCRNNFTGSDYISLCDYEKKNKGKGFKKRYNGFNLYALFDPSIMFPKDQIEVIEPIILEKMIAFYSGGLTLMKELGMSDERYTDLDDEVQVRDRIDIDKMCGLTIPTYIFLKRFKSVEYDTQTTYTEILKFKELLDKYGINVPFYDINTEQEMNTYENVYDVVLSLKRKK